MATATTELMTAEQFFDWANRPENSGKRYELVQGRIEEMPSPTRLHGTVCFLVSRVLGNYLFARKAGSIASNDSGLIVETSPDTVRGPDLMVFLPPERLDDIPNELCKDVPALVVEVRSPSDRDTRILKRVAQYHKRGVPLVWVVDPEDRIVTSYRPNEFPRLMDEADTLTGNGVLPDFSSPVSDLFRLPAETAPKNG